MTNFSSCGRDAGYIDEDDRGSAGVAATDGVGEPGVDQKEPGRHEAIQTEVEVMAEPVIVITRMRVKQGRLDDVMEFYKKYSQLVETSEPQLIALHGFLSDDGTEMTNIQVHSDPASLDFHMRVLRDNWDESFSGFGEMLDVLRVEYYGSPPQSARDMDLQFEEPVSLNPRHISGFTREIGRAAD